MYLFVSNDYLVVIHLQVLRVLYFDVVKLKKGGYFLSRSFSIFELSLIQHLVNPYKIFWYKIVHYAQKNA